MVAVTQELLGCFNRQLMAVALAVAQVNLEQQDWRQQAHKVFLVATVLLHAGKALVVVAVAVQ